MSVIPQQYPWPRQDRNPRSDDRRDHHYREAESALEMFERAGDSGVTDWSMGLRALVHAVLASGTAPADRY